MSKIPIIIAREFSSRVKKKSFIITTILLPLVMVAMIVIPVYVMSQQDKECTIYVLDDNDYFINRFTNTDKLHFEYPGGELESLKQRCVRGECDAVLHILGGSQSNQANLFFEEEPPLSLKGKVEEQMDKIIFDKTLTDSFHIDLQKYEIIKQTSQSSVATIQIDADGKERASLMELNRFVGIICGVLIYFFVFMYANQVMRSAIEEKSNRIIEIIISSVKPFEFMMGKIVGVALVGILQFALQIGIVFVLLVGIQFCLPSSFTETTVTASEVATTAPGAADTMAIQNSTLFSDISSYYSFPFTTLIICFFVYFLLGYLIYASLYAGLGSATDNETDSNQFVLPISLPLIFTIMAITMESSPQSGLIRCLSIIPFTSPIAMLYRIPSGVPVWELALSLILLFSTFLLCVWISAKIYRVGLLMYGKKVTWKELWRWIRM